MLVAFLLADCIESGDDVVEIRIGDSGQSKRREVLRLRGAIRFANRPASLRMTGLWNIIFVFACFLSSASATTYYVSSSEGSDSNAGTSLGAAWQTMGKVNAQVFLPGDSILFRRGDVWNEGLAPAVSGTAGNPITFDAYGMGAPPNLTGYYAVPSSAWVLVTGNAWKAAVPATFSTVNFCLFGSVWGQKVAVSTSNLTAQWNFYLANGFIYVFSVGSPANYYSGAIVPMALSNVPVININGKSWLTFQHLLVSWFDQYGVYVQGASDHLLFANMEVDSMIPQGTQPLGFYVNESTPGPGDIEIYNSEAHMNYDAFRFDGAATTITMVNDKAYGNRDGALVDNTGAVNYSYCHFYASSLAVAGSTDVEWTSGTGPTAGAGNVAQDTAPAVQAWQRYPAQVTLTVDDAGMTAGADSYYANTVLPIADALGVPVGAAITVGYPLAQTLVSEFQGWVNAGRDVTSHSMSHTYYTNTDALDIQYTGAGSAATMNISGKVLTITVTGAADSVSYNLAQGQAQGTIKAVRLALLATGKFTATEITVCQGPYGTGCSFNTESALLAQDLADVSSQDVKSAVYHMQLDVTRLTTDEITLSRQWMTTNLTGLPATPVYVYPGGYETPTMQGITASVPYSGARGGLKEDLGVKDTYASGFDVQNVISFGVNPTWMGIAPAALNQKVQALVWKQKLWGVPWGIFWHLNELVNNDPVGGTEITNLIQDLQNSGATVQTNTGLVNWLTSGTLEAGTDGNFYYKSAASSMVVDMRPTAKSPVVDAGQNLGTAYQIDINGMNQNSYGSGWEIGAHVFAGYSIYGSPSAGSSHFTVSGVATPCQPPNYCAYTGTGIVNWPSVPNMGGLTKNATVFYDTSFPSGTPSPVVRCTDTATDPTNSSLSKSAGLQGSGDAAPLFNASDTLLHVNDSGGDSFIVPFNPGTLVCSPAITANLNQSSRIASSTSFNFGVGYFDWQNANVYHGNAVAGNNTQLIPYTINPSTGTFTVGVGGGVGVTGTPEADFQYGLPMGSLVAAWQPSHAYSLGQYVSYNLIQSYTNLNATSANWGDCGSIACAGGGGIGTPSQTWGITNPSLDNQAVELSCGTASGDNCLFWVKPGFDDMATEFTTDEYVYFPSLTGIGNAEADTFEAVSISGTLQEFMWGSQCNYTAGKWQFWNQGNGTWNTNASVPCTSVTWPAVQWNHYILHVHRVPGDTSCSGSPAQYFDSITLNGTFYLLNLAYCSSAAPGGWTHVIGSQNQLDLNASTTAIEYVDEKTLTHTQATDWTPSYAHYAPGDIIQPTVNNALGCAFKLVTTGTTGSTEPNWNAGGITTCHFASWGTVSDGTTAWRYLGSGPTFTYQLTSASGTSGSSTPAFVPSTGHPDLMTTVTDGSLTWTNTGVLTAPSYRDLAGVSYDGTRFCEDTSTNTYGYNANYTANGGSQGTSIWAVCYSSILNEYVTLNTATGWQSVTTCVGGTGYNCAGGTFAMAPAGSYTAITTGGCGYFIHNMKADLTMSIPTISMQGANLVGSSGCVNGITGNSSAWAPFAAFSASTGENEYLGVLNHWAMLNTHLVQVGQAVNTTGFTTGIYSELYPTANPGILGDIMVSWQPTCTTSWTPNALLPPCEFGLAYDSHMSGPFNPGGADTSPVCGSIFNYATLAPPPVAPWQGEAICIPIFPTWAMGASPVGQNAPWRFTHELNTGSNSFFDVQFAISQESTDGKFLAFTSDWNCTLGNTAGGNASLCGAPWVGGAVYSAGQYVNPFSATGGSGTNYGVYKITTGGTSAATAPAWFVCNTGTAGNTVTDSNGVVYTCQGTGNGRGDVFIVRLAP